MSLAAVAFVSAAPTLASAAFCAYVSKVNNNRAASVAFVDTATNTVAATVPLDGPGDPQSIAVTPDDRFVLAGNYSAATVSVIDTATRTIGATIPVPAPADLAVAPDGVTAYAPNPYNTLSVIDLGTDAVTARIPTNLDPKGQSRGIAIAPDGATAYVANQDAGTVSVISLTTAALTNVIRVGGQPFRVALTPDGRFAYVTNFPVNTDTPGTVIVIDTTTNAVATTIPVGGSPGGVAQGVALSPDGALAYVTNFSAGEVAVIDTATNAVTATIPVGSGPSGVAFTPDGRFAYVAVSQSHTVAVIDRALGVVTSTIVFDATDLPTGVAIATSSGGCGAVPQPGVAVEVGRAVGKAGEQVSVDVTLMSAGQDVAGIQNDITATTGVRITGCAVNSSLGKDLSGFAFSVAGVRAIIVGNNVAPIPDGARLYTCTVGIAPDASPGSHRLIASHVVAAAPDGAVLNATGVDGAVVVPPPPTRTPTPTWTPAATATVTPTPTPLRPSINLGTVNGDPGTQAQIDATLSLQGATVAGTQNDIAFTASAAIAAQPDGMPDCAVNPDLGKNGAFAFLPSGCRGTACTGVRAIVFPTTNTHPIPDGSLLYTCTVSVAANASGAIPLLISHVILSDPRGNAIPDAGGTNGAVVIGASTRGLNPRVTISSAALHPGEQGTIFVSLETAGLPITTIDMELSFDATVASIAANTDRTPDCTVSLPSDWVGYFSFLPSGCSAAECMAMRAVIGPANALRVLPDAAVLYSCTLNVSPHAVGSAKLTAGLVNVGTDQFNDVAPDVTVTDGTIVVSPEPPSSASATGGGCSITDRRGSGSGALQILLLALVVARRRPIAAGGRSL